MLYLQFGDEPRQLAIKLELDGIPGESISGVYLTLHLPKDASPAKEVWRDDGVVPTPREITRVFDQDAGVRVECDVTAGASAYGYTLSVTYNNMLQSVRGVTGTVCSVTVGTGS